MIFKKKYFLIIISWLIFSNPIHAQYSGGIGRGDYFSFLSRKLCSLRITGQVLNNVSCFGGNNGSALVTPSDGTAPFTILWNPGLNTATTVTGLSPGNYSVTVTDALGCVASIGISITAPTALSANIITTNATCNGSGNGAASVFVAGGITPYSYSWSPSGGTAATATGLAAGNYNVTITDFNGCIMTATAMVSQPPALNLLMSTVSALCHGDNSGSASVLVSGGTAGYFYSWSPYGGNASSAGGLAAGNYTVSVSDANSCQMIGSVSVHEPTAVSLITNVTPSTCGAPNGAASVVAQGGTPGYTYSWLPAGGASANATGLASGAYTISVTDANGCHQNATVNVPNTAGPAAIASVVNNVSCHGGSDGSVVVSVTGGTEPYTGTGSQNGLTPGTHEFIVTDANGCHSACTTLISEPPVLVASSSFINNHDGTLTVTVSATGGTTPYAGTGAYVVPVGNYSYTVSDANGCSSITVGPGITIPLLSDWGLFCLAGLFLAAGLLYLRKS